MKFELKHGLIFFGLSMIPTMLYFIFGYNHLAGQSVLLSMIVNIIYLLIIGFKKRKTLGGFMDYGTGFKTLLLVSCIGGFIANVAGFILFSGSEDLKQKTAEMQKSSEEYSTKMLSKVFGVSEEEMKLNIENNQDEKNVEEMELYSLKSFLISLVSIFIFYLLQSLFLAIFIKKKQNAT